MRCLLVLTLAVLAGAASAAKSTDSQSVETSPLETSGFHESYYAIQTMLEQYLSLRDAGGWPAFSSTGPVLESGDISAEIPAMRDILWRTGDLAESARGDVRFNGELLRAVMRFQERHGLTADGIVGKRTRQALSVDVDARIAQLRLNLERARQLPRDPGERYIWINTAAFELEVYEGSRVPLSMRVIVGKQEHQTPVFSEKLSYLVVNPYWHVPTKLAVRDLIPAMLRNPHYFNQRGIRVLSGWQSDATELDPQSINWGAYDGSRYLPYKLRQDPGPGNALGRIKFMLPNRYSVYLHDTPGTHLFERPVRTFSSGCVRVEKPLELARYVIGRDDIESQQLQAIIDTGENQVISLPEPIPVYMVYQTAWVDTNGNAQFRDDIYARDPALAALIQRDVLPNSDTSYAGKLSVSAVLPSVK
jgi:murein L,D-transpeptidase YcbB/YkuD